MYGFPVSLKTSVQGGTQRTVRDSPGWGSKKRSILPSDQAQNSGSVEFVSSTEKRVGCAWSSTPSTSIAMSDSCTRSPTFGGWRGEPLVLAEPVLEGE